MIELLLFWTADVHQRCEIGHAHAAGVWACAGNNKSECFDKHHVPYVCCPLRVHFYCQV